MRPSILVVENYYDLRTEIVAALQREHYPCESVRDGRTALLKLRENDYSYILIDDDEATDARSLLARLKAEPSTREKIIVMSDFPDAELPYLRKPFDSKALLARLNATRKA